MEATANPSGLLPAAETGAPLGLIEKARVVAALGAAVVILYTMGWISAQPTDPALPLTFVRSGRAIPAIWPALAILTVVAGIIGTIVSGKRLPEAGLFAAAIGLAALSLHGGSMFDLMANEGATTPAVRAAFMKAMAIDCVLWSAVMFVTWIATSWAYRWIWFGPNAPASPSASAASTEPLAPTQPTAKSGRSQSKQQAKPAVQAPRSGWAALVVTGVIGVFVVWCTAGRDPAAPVQRGQTIAAVAAGLYFGAMGGRYFTGIRDVRWYLLAVPAGAILAWLVGYLSADMSWAQGTPYQYYIYLATTPVHDLARPLPIEYIAVGTAAVLAGFWGGDKMEQVAADAL